MAKQIDEKLKAPFARSTTQWLNQPNRYDIPTIDTPKKQTKSMRVTEAFFWKNNFDRLINKDYIEEKNSANKKAVKQILKTLDENSIPYYYGGEDTGIQVLTKDKQKAKKLTAKLYSLLVKSL